MPKAENEPAKHDNNKHLPLAGVLVYYKYMFSFTHRLTKKRDIEITLKNGKRRRGKFCHLVIWQVEPGEFPARSFSKEDIKIAVVVGKKVSKKATERNKRKRQAREVIKMAMKESLVRPGTYIVCLVQPDARNAAFIDLKQDIYALLSPRKS